MSLIRKTAIALLLAAAGAIVAAGALKAPALDLVALALLGVFLVLGGLSVLQRRRPALFGEAAGPDEPESAPAYILGAVLVLMGAALLFYALWAWLLPESAALFLQDLLQSSQGWGFLLMALGFFTFVFGFARLVAANSGGGGAQLERRLEGVAGMVVGFLLLAAGFWLVLR